MTSQHIEKAMTLLRGVSSGDADLATKHVNPQDFVQHDPFVADGFAGLREQASRSKNGHLEVSRLLEDGQFVVAHGRNGAGDGSEVFFAVFRFANDNIVEQWRFASPFAAPNVSGHTQTDGPTKPLGGQDTAKVKAIVRDYYETVHIAGRHGKIDRYMSGNVQIRHEPGVKDGVTAFKEDLALLTLTRTIDEIVLLVGQGDFVFIAARGTHESNACAYLDLYRVEADKLVEHWGFPQQFPAPEKGRNANGSL